MTKSLSITLPHDMASMVASKVASGEYATESDVVDHGLRVLAEHDAAIETWLRDEVVPAYDAAMSASPRALSADEAWTRLDAHMNAK